MSYQTRERFPGQWRGNPGSPSSARPDPSSDCWLTLARVSLLQEMLSRSSLETQKLELMSAMSELKLQQAALERENLDLRTNHLNNNLVNGNAGHNGSTGSIIRRPPMAPTRLTSTTSSASAASTPSPNIAAQTNGHPLGGSHGNLQQQGLPANGSSAPMVCGGISCCLSIRD